MSTLPQSGTKQKTRTPPPTTLEWHLTSEREPTVEPYGNVFVIGAYPDYFLEDAWRYASFQIWGKAISMGRNLWGSYSAPTMWAYLPSSPGGSAG